LSKNSLNESQHCLSRHTATSESACAAVCPSVMSLSGIGAGAGAAGSVLRSVCAGFAAGGAGAGTGSATASVRAFFFSFLRGLRSRPDAGAATAISSTMVRRILIG